MAAHLMETEGVISCGDRTVIPANLCQQALNVLHAGHAGVTTMLTKATQSLFWPGLRQDIINIKAQCQDCMYMLPSNPAPPSQAPMEPDFPFSHLCMYFFQVEATCLAVADCYTNWLSVFRLAKDDSAHVIEVLR